MQRSECEIAFYTGDKKKKQKTKNVNRRSISNLLSVFWLTVFWMPSSKNVTRGRVAKTESPPPVTNLCRGRIKIHIRSPGRGDYVDNTFRISRRRGASVRITFIVVKLHSWNARTFANRFVVTTEHCSAHEWSLAKQIYTERYRDARGESPSAARGETSSGVKSTRRITSIPYVVSL